MKIGLKKVYTGCDLQKENPPLRIHSENYTLISEHWSFGQLFYRIYILKTNRFTLEKKQKEKQSIE